MEGLKACPKCGGTSGYFRVTRMSGIGQTNYCWDESECAYNGELHECLSYTVNKTMYCLDCGQKVGIAEGE